FSSRRRHTRSDRDWSSDVCSSDLPGRDGARRGVGRPRAKPAGPEATKGPWQEAPWRKRRAFAPHSTATVVDHLHGVATTGASFEIGRASCRERGQISEGAGGAG